MPELIKRLKEPVARRRRARDCLSSTQQIVADFGLGLAWVHRSV
jgi:hypothetical protein